MTLSDVAIRRPVFTAMISLGIVVLGVMSFLRLGVDLFPDVQFPVVAITTVYPGASPTEVESQVTERLEEQLVSLNGIDTMISKSRESVSFVILQFDLDVDVEVAAAQVRERVSQARISLPREAEEPSVSRFDVSAAPIMVYTLSGQMDVQALHDYADDVLRPALEQVDGVATIRIRGGRERQINVLLDLERLEALHLTPLAIVEKIRLENLNVPAGSYGEGRREITVRTLGEVRSIQELGRIVVATGADGALVRLDDVARVEDGFADEDTQVRTNGRGAVVFEVLKTSGRNTVEVSAAVQERLSKMTMPRSVQASLIVNQSEFILENAHEVEVALIFGGAMAILVILLFMLDLRSTFISGLALPTSVIGTFALMYAFDFTLNMMTLLGLSLAIGLLVDDAIVVRENIMKHLERGADPITAAREGTREITLAVIATTLTICAVFVPVAFMGGLVGQFFQQFGLTVAAATVLSMWVAFTLDPMLSARLAKVHRPGEPESFAWLKRPFRWVFAWLDGSYHSLLAWMLAKKRRMALGLLLGVLSLVGSCSLVPLMGVEFVAPEDRGQYVADIELPAGTSLERTSELALAAEQELMRDPLIRTVYSTIGPDGDSHRVRLRVVAAPKWERTVGLPELKDRARAAVRRHMGANVEVAVSDPSFIEGGDDAPIMIYVRGENLADLEATANRFAGVLRSIPGSTDVDVDWAPGKPELQLAIRRDRAANLGVPAALIAGTLRASLEGELAGIYRDGNDEVDIRVRLADEDRESAANIARVPIPTRGGFVPLSDVAEIGRGDGPAIISRKDRARSILIKCGVRGRPLSDVVTEMQRGFDRRPLPSGVTYELEGQVKNMNESNANMMLALALGMIFIYLVLASQFESILHPVTIMMALPMAVVGALVALFLTGSSLSMGAMIGIILLMGLVTKNGILLVDHAVVRVREGLSPHEAILEAGPARMRPILMTSAAMVLGMLPTALSKGSGSEFRSPMAMGVIGGVISSTFLTLLVVPVLYLVMESVRRGFRAVGRWITGGEAPAPPSAPSVGAGQGVQEPPPARHDAPAE